jgi:hypothetical protein
MPLLLRLIVEGIILESAIENNVNKIRSKDEIIE